MHKHLKIWERKNLIRARGAQILDAGSGFGQYSYWLAKRNPRVNILAVDVKEEQVEDCNKFFQKVGLRNVTFRVEDLVTFQNPNSYDLILSVDVMEHILEDEQVFRNFYASLKEGGMVLINTPSDQGGSDVDNNSGESFIGEHVRDGYNIGEIQEKLKRAGFSKTEGYFTYGKSGSRAWKLSMKYPMTMLNKSMAFTAVLPVYYAVVYPFAALLNWRDLKTKHQKGTGLIVKAWK